VTTGAEPTTGNVDDGINGADEVPDAAPVVPDVDAGVVGAVVGAFDPETPDNPEPPDEEPADPDAGGVDAAGAGAPAEPEPDVDPELVDVGVEPSDDGDCGVDAGAGVVVEFELPMPVLLDVLGALEVSPAVEVEPLPAVGVSVPEAELVDEPVAGSAAEVDAGDTVRVVDDESSDELLPPEDAPPPVEVSALARPEPLINAAPNPTVKALVFTHAGTS